MIVLRDSFKDKLEEETVIALGSFDGLHKGHMALIDKAMEVAKKIGASAMVYSFSNHPLTVINKELTPKLLLSNEDKISILESKGVDIVNLTLFTEDFMKVSPEDFVLNMLKYYNCKAFVVGFNYRFGYKNLGDIELLKKLSKIYGFKLYVVDKIKDKNEAISSSKIRHLIEEGDVKRATQLLTRPYALSGTVMTGRKIGRTIGFRTLNLDYDKKYVIPKGGVYYTNVIINNVNYRGITNIGYNPTVSGNKLSIETHVLDFNEDIYNHKIKVLFIDKIRDEKKFNSLEELKNQLTLDKKFAKLQKMF